MSTLIRKLVQLGPSTDLKDTPRRGTVVTKTIMLIKYQFGINTRHNNSRRHAPARPYTEGLLTPCAFTEEVLDHEFPQGFKPVNIEAYDGTTDPGVWIEDFILHIHMARGDDLHAIKYLPLKLKGPARH